MVAFLALFGGFATPVEAAAVTALYAFFVETVIYRDLSITKDIPRAMTDCGLLIGGVLLIWGVALGVTDYMVDTEVRAIRFDRRGNSSEFPILGQFPVSRLHGQVTADVRGGAARGWVVSESATIQELRGFGLTKGVAKDLFGSIADPRAK